MKAGQVFTIEPVCSAFLPSLHVSEALVYDLIKMINLGSYHDVHWPDNWTATTADGRRSAQFEDTLLCVFHYSFT